MASLRIDIAIIGAGPAGLMAAEVVAQGGAHVTVYDAMPSAGRKFLMAGRGGLNLTHSEALPAFLARYGAATPRLAAAITAFPPDALRDWSRALGQPTFVGSSGRFFPKRSRPRHCCGPGCGGSTPLACNSRCATAGSAGRTMGGCRSRRPTGRA
jgi:predicted flavoprotein YhiN